VTVLVILAYSANDAHLIYPLDDTYIHMSMAKNLAEHGVWGVTRYEFSSSTTSPAWVALLASGYLLFGTNELLPLILNIIFGTLALVIAYRWISIHIPGRVSQFFILCAVLFITPLPTLTITGMEHVLHALLTVFFISRAERYLTGTDSAGKQTFTTLLLVSALLPMVRLEGAFTVLMVSLLLLLHRNYRSAVMLAAVGALPVVLYGIWSITHGWFFFPNSVLLKANIPETEIASLVKFVGLGVMNKIKDHVQLLLLLIFSLGILLIQFARKERPADVISYALIIFTGNVFLHLQFASTGWFFRYEAYLVMIGIISVCLGVHRLTKGMVDWKFDIPSIPFSVTAGLFLVLLLNIYSGRAIGSLKKSVVATKNIYEQQYQMGLFLKQYGGTETVVINDIGAVTFLSDVAIIDLWGLGTKETANLKMKKKLTNGEIERIAKDHHASIALVYETWFTLPDSWVETGIWRISDNVVAGNEAVNIYCVDPSKQAAIMERLKEFSSSLPKGVEQLGAYIE
jgi:hypothetical protein